MLTVTLISVCLGVGVMAPGLGIALAVLVTPAFIGTAMGAARRKVEGRPLDVGQKILAFAGSVGVVMVIGIAAGITFFVTCVVGGVVGANIFPATGMRVGLERMVNIGVPIGTVAAGLVVVVGFFIFFRSLWRKKM